MHVLGYCWIDLEKTKEMGVARCVCVYFRRKVKNFVVDTTADRKSKKQIVQLTDALLMRASVTPSSADWPGVAMNDDLAAE